MDGLTSTSFDRYARYRYLLQLRSEHFGASPVRLLDVGDPYGILQALLPEDFTVSLDLFKEGQPLAEMHSHVVGSGFQLPFPDDAFDIVSSHDVLEHLPAGTHSAFARELRRVSRGPVVLVAPFADARTTRCEEIANAYYAARTGHTLQPLDEHAEGDGLPSFDDLLAWADTSGIPTVSYSGGWLGHWLMMMMLKAHFAATGDIVADRSFDTAFNLSLQDRDDLVPHYRRAIILDPPAALPRPAPLAHDPAVITGEVAELMQIGWQIAGALTPGEDPQLPGSRFRTLWGGLMQSEGLTGELATSVERLIRELETQTHNSSPGLNDAAPSISVIVAFMDGDASEITGCIERLMKQVDSYDNAELIISSSNNKNVRTRFSKLSRLRFVEEAADDFVLRLNAGVAMSSAECLVFVDPRVLVPIDFLHVLSHAYCSSEAITAVAPRIDGKSSVALQHSFEAEGEALFAPKEAMLISRTSYVGLAGFDGSLLGNFDDLDLGWRLWIIGERVALVDLWCETAEGTGLISKEGVTGVERVCLYRVLLKNCETTFLGEVVGEEILSELGDTEAVPTDLLRLQQDYTATMQQRSLVQTGRRCADTQITGRFGSPSVRVPDQGDRHRANRPTTALFLGGPTSQSALLGSVRLLRNSSHFRLTDLKHLRLSDEQDPHVDLVIMPLEVLSSYQQTKRQHGKIIVDLSEASASYDLTASSVRAVSAFVYSTSTQGLFWRSKLETLLRSHGPFAMQMAPVPPVAPSEQHFGESGILDSRSHSVVLDCRGNAHPGALRELAASLLSQLPSGISEVVVVGSQDRDLLSLPGVVHSSDVTSSFLRAEVVVRHVLPDDIGAKLSAASDILGPFSCGTPVVTNSQDPVQEFILQDGGGIVAHDAVGIVRGVQRVLNDDLFHAAAVAGAQRTIATNRYVASRCLNELLERVAGEI